MTPLSKLIAGHPLISEMPYTKIKFAHLDHNRAAVYKVGSGKILRNAENALREAARRFGWFCFYCGNDWPPLSIADCTLDHIRAVSKKGAGNLHNLVLACKYCNREKGCLDLVDFRPERSQHYLKALDEHLVRCLKNLGGK